MAQEETQSTEEDLVIRGDVAKLSGGGRRWARIVRDWERGSGTTGGVGRLPLDALTRFATTVHPPVDPPAHVLATA